MGFKAPPPPPSSFGQKPTNPFGQEPSNPFGQEQTSPFGQKPANPFGQTTPPSPFENPQQPNGLQSLAEAALGLGPKLIESRDLWFNKKVVTLTGYKFTNCRFDGCELYVQSDNFEMESCFISPDTVIKFSDSSLRVLKIFNKDSEVIRKSMPNFAAIKNDDGTITIR